LGRLWAYTRTHVFVRGGSDEEKQFETLTLGHWMEVLADSELMGNLLGKV